MRSLQFRPLALVDFDAIERLSIEKCMILTSFQLGDQDRRMPFFDWGFAGSSCIEVRACVARGAKFYG